jgi:predicted Rossmann fold nucleotide-binding protein DprA/Smf involved in DNA uptake
MNIGFTGTQTGMSDEQKKELITFLIELKGKEFHHGDCIGADEEAHRIALNCGYEIHIHPPENHSKRAYCKIGVMYPPGTYLKRNHDIVNDVNMLIAAPKSDQEELRSGTWATIRYADKKGKKVIILKR